MKPCFHAVLCRAETALHGVRSPFAGADPDGFLHGIDEYLSVSDLAGVGRLPDLVHHLTGHLVVHDDFDLDLGDENSAPR